MACLCDVQSPTPSSWDMRYFHAVTLVMFKDILPKPVWRSPACFCLGGSKTYIQRESFGSIYLIVCVHLSTVLGHKNTHQYQTMMEKYSKHAEVQKMLHCCRDSKFLWPRQLFKMLLLLLQQYWLVLAWKSCCTWKLLQEEGDSTPREGVSQQTGQRGIWRPQ